MFLAMSTVYLNYRQRLQRPACRLLRLSGGSIPKRDKAPDSFAMSLVPCLA